MSGAERVPLFGVERQNRDLAPEIREAVERVIASGRFILGTEVAAFERELAEFVGARFGIGVASGTDALMIALRALGVGPGGEVITTPFTFGASAGAIRLCGAEPVFADIDRETFNLDPASVRRNLSPRTRAILPVHLFGCPAAMRELLAIGRDARVPVVEDAAQAIGASIDGTPVGALGAIGCFSFYPTKNLGAVGDGGFLATNDESLAARIRLLREHGSPKRYHYTVLGTNSRLDEMQAAVLRVKLKMLPGWSERREAVARFYREALSGAEGLVLPTVPKGTRHAWHLFVIRVTSNARLAAALDERGIGTGLYYPAPLHLQEAYAHLGYRKGDLPEAERACGEALSIPMHPEISDPEQRAVVDALRQLLAR